MLESWGKGSIILRIVEESGLKPMIFQVHELFSFAPNKFEYLWYTGWFARQGEKRIYHEKSRLNSLSFRNQN